MESENRKLIGDFQSWQLVIPLTPSLKTTCCVEVAVLAQDGDPHDAVTCLGQWRIRLFCRKSPELLTKQLRDNLPKEEFPFESQ